MTFETSKQSYERQAIEVSKEIENCIKNNMTSFDKFLILINPKLIKKVFKIVENSRIPFKRHYMIYRKNKLVFDKEFIIGF